MDAKLLKKITVKDCCGETTTEKVGQVLLRIRGQVEGVTQKATPYGEATAFLGMFVAVNTKGEAFQANTLYLPDKNAVDALETKVRSADVGTVIDFSGEVVVAASEKSPTKYTYIFRPVSTEENLNRAASMLQELGTLAQIGHKE